MKLLRRKTFLSMRDRLAKLYGKEQAEELATRLYHLIGRYGIDATESRTTRPQWTERDAVLITYADIVRKKGEPPLRTLKNFLQRRARHAINTVHFLPFYPSSSDGGFSVKDYRALDEEFGTWDDLEDLRQEAQVGLMFDLVLNHCSRESAWFKTFTQGIAPEKNYFLVDDPNKDWSKVVRPRVSPLFHETETADGVKSVWTTFSRDQVDLNWKEPDVLFEFVDILLGYISRGARIVRLDAVAFLWKVEGETCIHHEMTHEVVKLLRDLLIVVAPEVTLLTETNVSHVENISYFGSGDEAHMVYQFTLPPLLLHALLRGDSSKLQRWVTSLSSIPRGCTYLNFTASHDGIGLRGLEGWVEGEELDWLVEEVEAKGALLGKRNLPGGKTAVYELNVTYRNALSVENDQEMSARRFMCSQAVMLALQGVPAVYFHSLVGSENWTEGPQREGGENRDINRERLFISELEELLDDPESEQGWILNAFCSMLRSRRYCPAFNPKVRQRVIASEPDLFLLAREPEDGNPVLCCSNFSSEEKQVPEEVIATYFAGREKVRNLLAREDQIFLKSEIILRPYGTAWLTYK